MNSIGFVQSALSWLFRYPLLPLQMLFFFLIAWGRLGYGVGVDDLFWSERIWEQVLNGLTCGLLFGEILLVRYLLDPNRGQFSRIPFTIFPVKNQEIRDLGRFLALFWTISLLVLWGFKLFAADVWHGEVRIWPLFVGLVLSVALVSGVVIIGIANGLFAAFKSGPLYGAAAVAAGIFAAALAAIYVAHFAGAVLSPIMVICILLGLANAVYGFLAFRMPGSQHIVLVALIAVGLLLNSSWVSRDHAYKMTLPGLEPYYANPQRIDEEAVYNQQTKRWDRTDHYYQLLRDQTSGRRTGPSLIPSDEPLRKMKERWQAGLEKAAADESGRKQAKESKPRIILICTSGGGVRAAVWTMVVLEGLEQALRGDPGEGQAALRDHIRLFTGASGGMVGAGLYVANFENGPIQAARAPDTELGTLSSLLAKDSLRRTLQTMVLVDQPTLFWPGRVTWDRGREIERVWDEHTASLGDTGAYRGSPFRRTFADLKELERQGLRPSIIYSPMLVEDARRLLVSNLDLLDLTWTHGNVAGFQSFRKHADLDVGPDRPLLSLSAVELFRLFPEAQNAFQIGTAARMNASFPLVSPGVSLPTIPPRRVVDAGYYDNFGVDLAAMWLLRHEKEILEHTSGVAVIEIRAYRNGYARWHFQDKEAEKYRPDPSKDTQEIPRRDKGALEATLEWLSTPVEAISSARSRAAYYRNDELLDLLDKHFSAKAGKDFFTTLPFECEVDADLSWTLPAREARRISRAFYGDPDAADELARQAVWMRKRIEALKAWFGKGGK